MHICWGKACTVSADKLSGTDCLTGYYYVSATTSCVLLPANANACSSALIATGCVSGYTVYNGACIACTPGSIGCSAPV